MKVWLIDRSRKKVTNFFVNFIRDYQGQLPNLGDIFQPEAINWLIKESFKPDNDSGLEAKPLLDFLISTGYKDEPKVDRDGKPLLHRTTPVHYVCEQYRVDNRIHIVIRELFKIYDRFDVNYTDDSGFTHFHVACDTGCHDLVEKFLELGQDPNCLVSERVDTPLHVARNKEVVELLLRNGANPNLANYAEGSTLLHVVCNDDKRRVFDDDETTVKMIFDICDEKHLSVQINAQDKLGWTPLQLALKAGYKKMVECLLRNGADPNLANADGSTPLHVSSQDSFDDYDPLEVFFKVITEKHQLVQVDARDKLGRTPLQLAVAYLLPGVLDIILDHGADLTSFVFPTEIYFGTSFDQKGDDYFDNFKLRLAYGAIGVIDVLEGKGYELNRSDVRTIVKFFVKYELFEKSVDLGKCWYDAEDFAIKAKKIKIRDEDPTLSLYDVVRLRLEEAEKLLTITDHFKFWHLSNWWDFSKGFREACAGPLCEIMLRGLSRRWALDPFLELTHYQLPVLCCEMIIENLMNEDLWNICLATA